MGVNVRYLDNDNASFEEGTLTDVVAVDDGLELENIPKENIYGEIGNCNVLSFWQSSSSLELYNDDYLFESASLRVSQDADSGHLQIRTRTEYSETFSPDKYYFMSCYMKNLDEKSTISIELREDGNEDNRTTPRVSSSSTNWERVGEVFSVSEELDCRIQIGDISPDDLIDGLYDGIMFREITEGEYNNLTISELMEKYPFSDGVKDRHYSNGQRQSSQLDLSQVNDVESSTISWAETLNSQTITIETSVDGGSTWQTATNGGAIPNLPSDPTTLDIRQTLETNDTTETPSLQSLTVFVNGIVYRLIDHNTLQEVGYTTSNQFPVNLIADVLGKKYDHPTLYEVGYTNKDECYYISPSQIICEDENKFTMLIEVGSKSYWDFPILLEVPRISGRLLFKGKSWEQDIEGGQI